MKGDFSRFSYDPSKHYTGVLKQQGRVELDADWNEDLEIQDHLRRTMEIDLMGGSGVPDRAGGFSIGWDDDQKDLTISPDNPNRPGRMYVEGILCELDGKVYYKKQPDYPNPPALDVKPGDIDLVYLDVWQRHVTAVEDPDIQEEALGGPDTTTRLQTVWQVKVQKTELKSLPTKYKPELLTGKWPPAELGGGRLSTRGNYRGSENRLYRVEIHEGGMANSATFKWSRDNGSVVFPIDQASLPKNEVRVSRLGRDQVLTLRGGDWVEVAGDDAELKGEPGLITKILSDGIDRARRKITLQSDVSGKVQQRHPKVRRWDQTESDRWVLKGGACVIREGLCDPEGTWIELEDGVEICFEPGPDYRTGDYWIFAARAATSKVEQLEKAPPRGVRHYYGPLALVKWSADTNGTPTIKKGDVLDCRRSFGSQISGSWLLTGNSATNLANDFLGTVDNQPLAIRTNDVERMRITADGNVGIGVDEPKTTLHLPERGLQIGADESDASANFYLASAVTGNLRALRLYNGHYGSGSHLLTITPGGSIGTGMPPNHQPRARLEVQATGEHAGELGLLIEVEGKAIYDEAEDTFTYQQAESIHGLARGDDYGMKLGVTGGASGNGEKRAGRFYASTQLGSDKTYGVHSVAQTYGGATSHPSGDVYAFYGAASGGGVGTKYGIFATASGGGTTFAGYFSGRVQVQNGRLRISESDGTRSSGVLELSNGTKTNFLFTDGSSGHLHLRTDSAAHHLLLQSDGTQGNVGIGTASPQAPLQIYSAEPQLRLDSAGNRAVAQVAKGGALQWDFGVGTGAAGNNDFWFGDFTNYRLVLQKGTGNVGIGTSNPQRRLQIGGDDVAGIGFAPSDASPNAGYVRWGDNTGWKLHFGRSRESAGGALNAGAAGVLMTLQDNGNVGIGTASPQVKLHAVGDRVRIDAGGGRYLDLRADGADMDLTSYNADLHLNHTAVGGRTVWYYNLRQGSSRALKENITNFSVEEAMEALDGLNPVFFNWRDDEEKEMRLGFVAEDTPRIVTGPERTGIIPMHMLAILTKVVQEQQRMIGSMRRQLDLRGEI